MSPRSDTIVISTRRRSVKLFPSEKEQSVEKSLRNDQCLTRCTWLRNSHASNAGERGAGFHAHISRRDLSPVAIAGFAGASRVRRREPGSQARAGFAGANAGVSQARAGFAGASRVRRREPGSSGASRVRDRVTRLSFRHGVAQLSYSGPRRNNPWRNPCAVSNA